MPTFFDSQCERDAVAHLLMLPTNGVHWNCCNLLDKFVLEADCDNWVFAIVVAAESEAADLLLLVTLLGFFRMYSARRVSKSPDLPITDLLDDEEWDLQVRERMQGFPEGAMMTPQWRSRSNCVFLTGLRVEPAPLLLEDLPTEDYFSWAK